MGIFTKLFEQTEDKSNDNSSPWITLTSLTQLKEIETLSTQQTVLIFKHSTRCGISRSVLRQFEKMITEDVFGIQFYYLDLLNYREISNAIAERYAIVHQSPQVLIIKNNTVVAHDSHYDITTITLAQYL